MNNFSKKKIADYKVPLIGGVGFFNSNLCETLPSLDADIICLDNFTTRHRHNLDAFEDNPDITLIEGDIHDLDIENIKLTIIRN